jgi:hypothetical protein
VRHRRSRLALLAGIAVLAAPVGQSTAGLAPVRQPGPLLNLAAPFNQPPGPGPRVTAAGVVVATPTRSHVRGRSLIDEAAPWNAPSEDGG